MTGTISMTGFLMFRAGACDLAVSLSDVREVVPAAALTKVPGDQIGVEGFLNLRGTLIPVVSLKSALSVTQPEMQPADFLIIVTDPKQRLFAIRTQGETNLIEDSVITDAADTRDSGILGQIQVGDRIASVINAKEISPHDTMPGGKHAEV